MYIKFYDVYLILQDFGYSWRVNEFVNRMKKDEGTLMYKISDVKKLREDLQNALKTISSFKV